MKQDEVFQKKLDDLRAELLDYIDEKFDVKQKEFRKFIEEDLDIEDQLNVDDDNVINAFYKNHNTVNKMYDNFRLFEYKRQKYVQKKKENKSLSPARPVSGQSPAI